VMVQPGRNFCSIGRVASLLPAHDRGESLETRAPAVDKPPVHRTSLWTAPTGSVA